MMRLWRRDPGRQAPVLPPSEGRTGSLLCLISTRTICADLEPFVGDGDNTNILSWLWTYGVAVIHGGSTQNISAPAQRSMTFTADRLEITCPGESKGVGKPWTGSTAFSKFGDREPTTPWTWAGPADTVTGPAWGGCIEVIQWILTAGRFPTDTAPLDGGVFLPNPARTSSRRRSLAGSGAPLANVDCLRRPMQ